jgi:aspartyl protease family protein
MRNLNPMPSIALAVLLTLSAGLPGLRAPSHVKGAIDLYAITEIKGGTNGHFFTHAYVNNQTLQVLVDTGASAVALSYEDADRVGLSPRLLSFDVPVNTANGMVKAARAKLSKVEIDNVRVDNVDALVLPEGALNVTLLGMSFLSRLSSFAAENGTLTLKN